MNVPLLDLHKQYETLKVPIKEAIDQVLDSQAFIMGNHVQELEKEVAEFTGCKHAIACASGSDALLISLMGLNVKPGDLVLTSPYTFFATGGAISRLGATPVFLDIEKHSYNLDPQNVAMFMKGTHPLNESEGMEPEKVVGIIPVHLYGQTADMGQLKKLADKYDLFIVEDAAQAMGAKFGGQQVGHFGQSACFSFFPSKNLGAYGDAGMIVTNDDELAEKFKILTVHGAKPKYHHKVVGINSRLDTIQAAILRVKLPHLAYWSAKRREIALRYNELFEKEELNVNNVAKLDDRHLILPSETHGSPDSDGQHIYHQYVIRVKRRDELQAFLTEKGIGTAIYYPIPLHEQECFYDLGYDDFDCPKASAAAKETLALPIFPELERAQQDYVVQCINEFLSYN